MLASLTVISRANSGFMRTSEAMELSVLKRKCGLICRCRASSRASSSSRFCSSSFISMRSAFQTFSAMPTSMGALSHTSTCNHDWLASRANSRCGKAWASQSRHSLRRHNQKQHQELAVDARLAQVAPHPAVKAQVDERRERPDLFLLDKSAQQPAPRPSSALKGRARYSWW